MDLKNNLFYCKLCDLDIYGKVELEKHCKEDHSNSPNKDYISPSLNWMIVIPGLDHLRINAVKGIIHAFWEPYFKDLFYSLGYQTPKAQNVAFAAGDLRKSEQGLAVILEAGTQYLVKCYSEFAQREGKSPNFANFLTYIKRSDDKTINLFELTYEYILGYFILKGGIRRCHASYVFVGKSLLSPIIFGRNHPMYRKVYLFFDMDMAQMPPEIYSQVKDTFGLKIMNKGKNDSETRAEHYDFILENVNKKIKSNLNWAPSNLDWLFSCRSYGLVENLIKNFNKYFDFNRYV